MPVIPSQTSPSVAAAGPSGAFSRADVDPNAFGASIGEAQRRVGAAGEQLGNTLAEAALKLQAQFNEADVDNQRVAYSAAKRDIIDKFYGLQGKDAVDQLQPTAAQLADTRLKFKAGLANPEQARMFDYLTHRDDDHELNNMGLHAMQQGKVYLKQSDQGAIKSEIDDSARDWQDNVSFANHMGQIKYLAERTMSREGFGPDDAATKAAVTHAQGEAWTARLRSVMAQDPGVARQLFDANAEQIDAPHRAMLDQQITQATFYHDSRAAAAQAKLDAQAERQFHILQTSNYGAYVGAILKGHPPSASEIGDAVSTGQISPTAAEAIFIFMKKAGSRDQDNVATTIALHKMIGENTMPVDLQIAMINRSAANLTPATAGALIDKVYATATRDESPVDHANFETLKTLMNGHAIEKGIVDIGGVAGARAAQSWAKAQSEWTQRVLVSKGDSTQVLRDMIPKYVHNPQVPLDLPTPATGVVASSADVTAAQAKLDKQLRDRVIDKIALDQQAGLLYQYNQFFKARDDKSTALKALGIKDGEQPKLRGGATQ